MDKRVGHYSYIVGVILAVVLGIAGTALGAAAIGWLSSLLVVLGLIVGFMNVTGRETKDFLMVSVILVIVAGLGSAGDALGGVQLIGAFLAGVFKQLLAFVVPATVVVSLKEVLTFTKMT
ncbi:hypothetical protein HY491_00630 [Candidatus Woesearchaeota archaeon]|nr:hypothetical protein [Candidatus Woesearchaeota archaeon]